MESLILFLKQAFYWPFLTDFKETFGHPVFLIGIIGIFVLERIIPADKTQKIFSRSFFEDVVYFIIITFANGFIVLVFVDVLYAVFNKYLSFLILEPVRNWPYWVRFVWGALCVDFLHWVSHYLRHRVSWFWHFHAVHHAQKNLNMFTDYRYHVLEYFITHAIRILPLFMFVIAPPQIVWWTIFKKSYTRFYHSNIKLDMGPLKYILVTPQSHRIHHSYLPEHRDKNFGVIFCIWDRIFKTHVDGAKEEYPKTGIHDDLYPYDTDTKKYGFFSSIIHQTIYPIRAIVRDIKSKKTKHS